MREWEGSDSDDDDDCDGVVWCIFNRASRGNVLR